MVKNLWPELPAAAETDTETENEPEEAVETV